MILKQATATASPIRNSKSFNLSVFLTAEIEKVSLDATKRILPNRSSTQQLPLTAVLMYPPTYWPANSATQPYVARRSNRYVILRLQSS